MKRIVYITFLILPISIIAFFWKDNYYSIFPYYVLFYIPILSIIRMKYIGMTWKEILKSLIPFLGIRNRLKVFTKK